MDLSANVDRLIVKELANVSDMNLQHPELIPLLIATEPKLKENEWIEVRGLMSRATVTTSGASLETGNDAACVCIVERTTPLVSDDVKLAQESCFSILQRCFDGFNDDIDSNGSSEERSKTAAFSSKVQSCNVQESVITDDEKSDYKHKPKRQCFEDRLKHALERGCTPETPEDNDSSSDPNGKMIKV